MDQKVTAFLNSLNKRNISGFFCQDKNEANLKILSLMPESSSVGISGSRTLDQLAVVEALEKRGNKVFNPYRPGLSREESLELRRLGTQADYYLASANAVSESGEMVFFSGYGNRIAGISNAKNVLIVCGVNKITTSLDAALKRAREYATPLNCKRLNWPSACLTDGNCRQEVCFSPEYKRMCAQILVIESEVVPGRLKVILVGEELGF